ncbi:WAP four-disulfide core domain 1 [Cricetulus griseus]
MHGVIALRGLHEKPAQVRHEANEVGWHQEGKGSGPAEVTRAGGNPATSPRMSHCGRKVLWALGFLLLLGASSAQGTWEAMVPARLAKSRAEEGTPTGPRQPHADRCPPPPRTLPPGACQATRCQADSECPRHRRCCYNGCAYACLEAVPPPPGPSLKAGHIELPQKASISPSSLSVLDWLVQPKPRWLGGNGWLLDGPEEVLQAEACSTTEDGAEPLLCPSGYECHILRPGDPAQGIPNRGQCVKQRPQAEGQILRQKHHKEYPGDSYTAGQVWTRTIALRPHSGFLVLPESLGLTLGVWGPGAGGADQLCRGRCRCGPAQGRSSPGDQVDSTRATWPPGKPGRAAAAASLGPQGRGQGLRPASRRAVEQPGHPLTMGRRLKFLQKLAFLGQDHRYKALEKDEVETLIDDQCELKAIEREKSVTALPPREACKCSKEDLASAFLVDLESGLSEMAVAQRRLVHGWNEFVTGNVEPVWKKYLDQVGAGRPSLYSLGY